MSERETCLIKIPSRISADTRIARSRLSLSLLLSDRPPRDGVGNLPLAVVVRSCCVVFSLLLIAGEREREREEERLGNVITDNKCNWADRRRRREEKRIV